MQFIFPQSQQNLEARGASMPCPGKQPHIASESGDEGRARAGRRWDTFQFRVGPDAGASASLLRVGVAHR